MRPNEANGPDGGRERRVAARGRVRRGLQEVSPRGTLGRDAGGDHPSRVVVRRSRTAPAGRESVGAARTHPAWFVAVLDVARRSTRLWAWNSSGRILTG